MPRAALKNLLEVVFRGFKLTLIKQLETNSVVDVRYECGLGERLRGREQLLLKSHCAIKVRTGRVVGVQPEPGANRRGRLVDASAQLQRPRVGPLYFRHRVTMMNAAGSNRATIYGWSEGGQMSLMFAATHPERISRLVLYGTYASIREAPWP